MNNETSKYFIREVSVWLNLNHKNIVKIHNAGVLPVPYLEREHVEDWEDNKKPWRLRKPIEEISAIELIKGIAVGLKYAHSKGI